MNLSLRRKKSAESNKIDKAKPSIKSFKQIYQENKNRPLTKNEKRGWAILGGIIIAILVIAHVSNVMEQSRLEKDNVPIVISDVEDNIKLDYSRKALPTYRHHFNSRYFLVIFSSIM